MYNTVRHWLQHHFRLAMTWFHFIISLWPIRSVAVRNQFGHRPTCVGYIWYISMNLWLYSVLHWLSQWICLCHTPSARSNKNKRREAIPVECYGKRFIYWMFTFNVAQEARWLHQLVFDSSLSTLKPPSYSASIWNASMQQKFSNNFQTKITCRLLRCVSRLWCEWLARQYCWNIVCGESETDSLNLQS